MRPRARIGCLAALCLAMAGALRAADAPATYASVALRDGRVLHNVRVMSDDAGSVVVRADEGLLKLAKSDLPQAVAEAYPDRAPPGASTEYVMQRFDPNQAPEAPPPEPGGKPKPKPKPSPGPPPEASAVHMGCAITGFQKRKAFENVLGCAEVTLQNDSDAPAPIRAADFVCVSADGTRHVGRNLFANTFPPSVKRRDVVPARGQLVDIVSFSNEDMDVALVQWSR